MTFDFVKVTTKSRFHVGPTINFVHYVDKYFFHDRAGGVGGGGNWLIHNNLKKIFFSHSLAEIRGNKGQKEDEPI